MTMIIIWRPCRRPGG